MNNRELLRTWTAGGENSVSRLRLNWSALPKSSHPRTVFMITSQMQFLGFCRWFFHSLRGSRGPGWDLWVLSGVLGVNQAAISLWLRWWEIAHVQADYQKPQYCYDRDDTDINSQVFHVHDQKLLGAHVNISGCSGIPPGSSEGSIHPSQSSIPEIYRDNSSAHNLTVILTLRADAEISLTFRWTVRMLRTIKTLARNLTRCCSSLNINPNIAAMCRNCRKRELDKKCPVLL